MSKWIGDLKHLMEFHSVTSSARDNRNARGTGFHWIGKVSTVLDGIQDDVVLKGRVYLDEAFFKAARSDVRKKDGKELRGISRNRICVGALVDSDSFVSIVENVSKPSRKSTSECLGTHIRTCSILVHDGDNSHSLPVEKPQLTSEVHTAAETKGLEDRDNPLGPVNSMHPLMKRFVRWHGGYRREDPQHWMDLIWFILAGPDSNVYVKLRRFLVRAVRVHHAVRYRSCFGRKARIHCENTENDENGTDR